MPTLGITRTYADGDVLFQADIDNIIDDLETLVNVTKLDDDNIQDNGIDASTKVIDSSVTAGKIASSAITTAKINNSAVTTAKIADGNVTTAKLDNGAVTTAKITDASITYAKRAALTLASGTNASSFSTTSTSYVDVTSITAAMTTTGRSLLVCLQNGILSAASGDVVFKLLRDSTDIGEISLPSATSMAGPHFIDTPTAGTYTYKLQAKSVTGAGTASTSAGLKIVVVEL